MSDRPLDEFRQQTAAIDRILAERTDAVQIRSLVGSWPKRLTACVDHVLNSLRAEGEELSQVLGDHTGPCLQHFLHLEYPEKLAAACLGDKPKGGRCVFIQLMAQLLQVRQSLLLHQTILICIANTIEVCEHSVLSEAEEDAFSDLLYQMCIRLMDDLTLLTLFFGPSSKTRPSDSPTRKLATDFPTFGALLPFMHRMGKVGARARDALLLCMHLTQARPEVGRYIVRSSSFCQTLAGGLSGLYSALPAVLPSVLKSGWRLTGLDVALFLPELSAVLISLEFCNSVVRIAHKDVGDRVLELLYDGFLLPVICPALHQTSPAHAVAATAYFDICVRSIQHHRLMHVFIRFVLESNDDVHAMAIESTRTSDLLVARLEAKGDLLLVTLRLLNTLISLNCEEVVLELCLKALVSGAHLADGTPDPKLTDTTLFSAATAFLALRPSVGPKSPGGLTFRDTLNDTRRAIVHSTKTSRGWSRRYDAFTMASDGPISPIAAPATSDGLSGEGFYRAAGGLFKNLKNSLKLQTGKEKQSQQHQDAFWNALFRKVKNMLHQPLQVNLLLTELLSRLVCQPQPILRDFLLNPTLHMVPRERPTLYRALAHVAQQIAGLVQQMDDFEDEYLLLFDSVVPAQSSDEVGKLGDGSLTESTASSFSNGGGAQTLSTSVFDRSPGDSVAAAPNTATSSSPRNSPRLFRKVMNVFRTRTGSGGGYAASSASVPAATKDQPRSTPTTTLVDLAGESTETLDPFSMVAAQAATMSPTEPSPVAAPTGLNSPNKAPRGRRKAVLGVLIFDEFLKEVSAACFEHSILNEDRVRLLGENT